MIYESHLDIVKSAVQSQLDALCSISIAEDISKQFSFGASLESVLCQLQAARKSIERFKSIGADDNTPLSAADDLRNKDYVYVLRKDDIDTTNKYLCVLDSKFKDNNVDYCIFTNIHNGYVFTVEFSNCEIYSISQ